MKDNVHLRELSLRSKALLKAMGYTSEELEKPRIGIANTWSETSPGHYHLRNLADAVKAGIWQAGGTPFEFSSFAQCPIFTGVGGLEDGGIRYDTPTRDIVAASVEASTLLHAFDGLVLLSSCDKNVPGHLLAAARLNIPSIIVTGGPMLTGIHLGKKVMITDVDLETYKQGMGTCNLSIQELEELEECVCPGPGACALLGTANTMQCISEALGLTLPRAGTAIAGFAKQLRIAKASGKQIVELVKRGLRPAQIMTSESLENAVRVLHALGGSTNAVVHILALCEELDLEVKINLATIEKLGEETPWITDVKPGGQFFVQDLDEAGGVQAVLKRLESMLNLKTVTVNGNTLEKNLENVVVKRPEVIHSLENPLSKNGLIVLRGNLADSAIVRPMVIPDKKTYFKGPARVYNSQEEAIEGLKRRELKKGEVLVVRYEGPRGGPGLTEVFRISGYLQALEMDTACAFVTDGKISGFGKSFYVVQVSPEAYVGGTLALVENGDTIEIDLSKKKLELLVDEGKIKKRRKKWTPPKPRVHRGFLTLYARFANSSAKGAGLNLKL